LFIIFALFLGIIYLYVHYSDDKEVAETNNIQTPSNPESNSTLDLDKPIINPNALNASTASKPQYDYELKTNANGFTWVS